MLAPTPEATLALTISGLKRLNKEMRTGASRSAGEGLRHSNTAMAIK
jgi:hypothetical protein